jgi:hypothetical protein
LIVHRDIRHNRDMNQVDLLKELHRRELTGVGWTFSGSRQVSLEATCLANFSVLAEQPSAAPQVFVRCSARNSPTAVGQRSSAMESPPGQRRWLSAY